jgi:hypothetical protein
MTDDGWVEVASGPDLATARTNLRIYLEMHGLSVEAIDAADLRIDTIRGEFEDRRRIMLRKRIVG